MLIIGTLSQLLMTGGTERQIVHEFDSLLTVADIKTQSAHIDQAISQEITLARLCTVFARLALDRVCWTLWNGFFQRRTAHKRDW